MAAVLRLADLYAGTTVDLLAGTLSLRPGSWETRTSSAQMDLAHSPFGAKGSFKQYDSVTESLGLIASGRTVADLADAVNAIEALQELCRRWHNDPLERYSVWLEWNANGESAKRSLVYDIRLSFGTIGPLGPMMTSGVLPTRLVINRHPLWEDTSTTQYSGGGSISATGGWFANPTTYGTAPGRIASTVLYPDGAGTDTFDSIWCGIRPTYMGTTGFLSTWECEDGTYSGGTYYDTALAGEAGCSPSGAANNKLLVDFANYTSLQKRVQIAVGDVVADAGDYPEQYGRYVVLCRCKLSAAGTVGLQLRSGFVGMTDSEFVQAEEVFVTNTAYKLIELGEFSIPLESARGNLLNYLDDLTKQTALQIWAEQVTGTPSISLDCLVLIPATHYIKLTGCALNPASVAGLEGGYFFTHEDDTTQAVINRSSSAPAVIVEHTVRDWYLPHDGFMFVGAAERGTGHLIADTMTVLLNTYHRWLSYRGS